MSLNIGRYDQDFSKHGWAGWIEPADRTWIAFVKTDHTIVVYLDRDPVSGHPTHRDPPGMRLARWSCGCAVATATPEAETMANHRILTPAERERIIRDVVARRRVRFAYVGENQDDSDYILEQHSPSTEQEAKALGCTCEWWGKGAIIRFDDRCPIVDRHRRPALRISRGNEGPTA